jgi:hypothetical protein
MKMTSSIRNASILAVAMFAAVPLFADTITLKSGEKLEGKILSETADSITLEYKLTAKIKDTKIIAKSNVQEIKKLTPSQTELAEKGLLNLVPSPDLLTAPEYESIIQDKLRAFIAKYPGTPEAAEVEKVIATLSEEKAKVTSGQVKVEGKWLDASIAKRDVYNIDAYRQRMIMKQKAAVPSDLRYVEALRAFETLREKFGASTQYVRSIPEALEILDSYAKQLTSMISVQPIIQKQRDDGLKGLPADELSRTKASIQAEEQTYKNNLDLQLKTKVKWRDINKYDIKGLLEAQTIALAETKNLQAMDVAALQKDNEIYMAIIRYLADGNLTAAETTLDRITKAATTALPPIVRKRAKELKAEEAKRKNEEVKASVQQPTTPGAAADKPAADSANPMAEILKEQEAKQKAKLKAAADEKAAADAAKAKAVVVAPVDEDGGFTQYIPYAGGGLLVVLLGALYFGKKKKEE